MTFSEVGAVWRKWDLHVHTPFSALNNGFGNDWDIYVRNLLTAAIANDIYAIGITDYFTIDGYKKIKSDYLLKPDKLKSLSFNEQDIERINKILFIPNIEFRLDILIPTRKINSRVNFHVLFSEEVSTIDIEEKFLHDIDFISEGRPQDTDETRKLKVSNLIELGQRLRFEQEEFKVNSDLVVGMNNVFVSATQICELLNKNIFKDKYILATPADEDLNKVDWRGQGHNARKVIIQKSDCLMTSNPNTISWGLGLMYPSVQKYINEFKSVKPCIWGSDAHDASELFVKNKDKLLWLKSDLSFDGLKQIIHEPKRVYIGIEPDNKKYVDLNSSNFLERLVVKKKTNLPSNEDWFDQLDIEINSGLVAIIGNKGGGKSALADILGLCGNSKKYNSYSFLNKERFNLPPEQKAKYFEASLYWKDGRTCKVSLDDKPIEADSERVNYIPQSFLEKLCLGETDKYLFEQELRKIIFSRLPTEKRLHKNLLDEVINFKTENYRNNIEQIKSDIHLLNEKIVELEEQSKPEYRKKIYDDLKVLAQRITSTIEREPEDQNTLTSTTVSVETQEINDKINFQRNTLEMIEDDIEKAILERENLSIEIQSITKTVQAFVSFKETIQKFLNSQSAILLSNDIEIKSIFDYSIDISRLDSLLINKQLQLANLNTKLEPFNSSGIELIEENIQKFSLYSYKQYIENSIGLLQNKLDEPAREHQEYLSSLTKWQQDLSELHYETSKLEVTRDYVDNLLSYVLAGHYEQREELLINLYLQKKEIINVFKELYEPVIEFKNKYRDQLSSYKIDFDAAFKVNNFLGKFDNYINYGKSGSFYNKDDAAKKVNDLMLTSDFDELNNVIVFVNTITKDLLFDTRDKQRITPNQVKSQLKQNIKPVDLYDFIFKLDYLDPIFQLKLAGKELSSLSPGERGALLLIFYLLLDNDKTPLIIDQPEENLDNQSIYSILVPFIQEAKQRRQVILITHNPNLAVVCDADQIIHVKIDKSSNHKVTCTSGSIENPAINSLLIEVLEGTFPAFDTRNQRYNVTRTRISRINYNGLNSVSSSR